jgi:hypothetical protein
VLLPSLASRCDPASVGVLIQVGDELRVLGGELSTLLEAVLLEFVSFEFMSGSRRHVKSDELLARRAMNGGESCNGEKGERRESEYVVQRECQYLQLTRLVRLDEPEARTREDKLRRRGKRGTMWTHLARRGCVWWSS